MTLISRGGFAILERDWVHLYVRLNTVEALNDYSFSGLKSSFDQPVASLPTGGFHLTNLYLLFRADNIDKGSLVLEDSLASSLRFEH